MQLVRETGAISDPRLGTSCVATLHGGSLLTWYHPTAIAWQLVADPLVDQDSNPDREGSQNWNPDPQPPIRLAILPPRVDLGRSDDIH